MKIISNRFHFSPSPCTIEDSLEFSISFGNSSENVEGLILKKKFSVRVWERICWGEDFYLFEVVIETLEKVVKYVNDVVLLPLLLTLNRFHLISQCLFVDFEQPNIGRLVYDVSGTLKSNRPEVLCKKGVFKNFAKFTGKHPRQNLFLIKL